jgi:hypothetical protein
MQALHYESVNLPGMAAGSALTSKRALAVLEACGGVNGSLLPRHIERMLLALRGETANVEDGDMYEGFVKKWGYDSSQRSHCAAILQGAYCP